MISVVCPFYNEEAILEGSVRLMLRNLEALSDEWELLIVNDGSTDGSLQIAHSLEKRNPKLRVVGYPANRGRGYALRTGVAAARGDIVVTTEIDSSWGDDIVARIVEEFRRRPDAEIIIASPHLEGGGYKNVPARRVFLSTLGNYIIRAGLTFKVTMNTGMTRGYKRDRFLALPLDEDEKEMHLEIVSKALAFGYRIYEIPAVLEWKDHKLAGQAKRRRSSSRVNKLVRTHLIFSLMASPFRYILAISALLVGLALALFGLAVYHLFTPTPSSNFLLTSLFVGMFAFLIFTMAVLSRQGLAVVHEVWRLRRELNRITEKDRLPN